MEKKNSKKTVKKSAGIQLGPLNSGFITDIRKIIDETRSAVAVTVNAGMTIAYWRIGKRIKDEILKGQRAGYGEKIVVSLSRQLMSEYGNSFSEKNLRRMIQFYDVFPNENIVATLLRQLSWSHFTLLIPIKESCFITENLNVW